MPPSLLFSGASILQAETVKDERATIVNLKNVESNEPRGDRIIAFDSSQQACLGGPSTFLQRMSEWNSKVQGHGPFGCVQIP